LALRFQPNNEELPGFGQEVTATGTVEVVRFNLSGALKGLPPAVAKILDSDFQAVRVPNAPDWEVSRHAPRGFKFSALEADTKDTTDTGSQVFIDYWRQIFSGSFCGENPFTAPWNMHVDTFITGSHTDEAHNDFVSPVLTENETPSSPIYAEFHMLLQPPDHPNPQMQLVYHLDNMPPSQTWDPNDQTHVVPVTEDMSCPPPTP
jgi:hypothetical protein